MIAPMTDRGLPIVDGAPACPFVAFEDDRDTRATAPDHRHRCFAEPRPALRALAHQEAYCLSSAFPVCPAFQDWARREAAAARPAPAAEEPGHRAEPPVSRPMPPREREPRHAPGTDTPPPIGPRRNPHRDWAAPPPWAGDEPEGDEGYEDAEPPGFLAGRVSGDAHEEWAADSRGLAGSAAARLAGPDPDAPPPLPRASRPDRAWDPRSEAPDDDLDERVGRSAAPPVRREQVRRRPPAEPEDLFGPAWERPSRYEAYPTLRTRVGLPSLPGLSRLGIGVVALVLAAVILFFVGPMLLGLGSKSPDTGASATPSPSAEASTSPAPTGIPAPTPQIYVVVKGDLLSTIATRFGVTVDQIMAANPQIKNADKIAIGDQITIPAAAPTSLPDQVSESASP